MSARSQIFNSSISDAVTSSMPGRQRVGAIRHIPASPTSELSESSSQAYRMGEAVSPVMRGIQWALGLEIAGGVFLYGLWRLCHLLF